MHTFRKGLYEAAQITLEFCIVMFLIIMLAGLAAGAVFLWQVLN